MIVIATSAGDEAIPKDLVHMAWDCFAEFILGPAGGRTLGLAMTRKAEE
jgi:hypothetical protein